MVINIVDGKGQNSFERKIPKKKKIFVCKTLNKVSLSGIN